MMNNQFSNVTIGYMGYILYTAFIVTVLRHVFLLPDLAQLIEIEVWTIQNSIKQVKYFQN